MRHQYQRSALQACARRLVASALAVTTFASCVRHVTLEQPATRLDDQFHFLASGAQPTVSEHGHCMNIPLQISFRFAATDVGPHEPAPVTVQFKVKAKKLETLDRRSAGAASYEPFDQLQYRAQLRKDIGIDVDSICTDFPSPMHTVSDAKTSPAWGELVFTPDSAEAADGRAERNFVLTLHVEPRPGAPESEPFLPGLSQGDVLELQLREKLPSRAAELVPDQTAEVATDHTVGIPTEAVLRLETTPGAVTSIVLGLGLVFGFTVIVL